MSKQFVRLGEIQAKHPEVSAVLAQSWAKFCPWLGREVHHAKDPTNPTRRLYCAGDFDVAFSKRRTSPPPDEFTDSRGTWLWIQRLRRHPEYSIAPDSIRGWHRGGCAALGGNKLCIRREWYWPPGETCNRRDYVRMEDLDLIVKRRHEGTPATDDGWVSRKEAEKILSAPTLIRYSNSGHYHREKAGETHPLLGRLIKTDIRKTISNGQTVTTVYYWRADLLKLAAHREAPAQWATWRQAVDEYGIPPATLEAAVSKERGGIRVKKFPTMGQGRPTMQRYFYRPDLKALSERREDDRDGGQIEVLNEIHAHTHAINSRTKKMHRDGKAVRAAVVKPPKPTAKKRGRPDLDADEVRDRLAIVERWQQAKSAGVSQKDFCEDPDRPVPLNRLEVCLNWYRKRQDRGK